MTDAPAPLFTPFLSLLQVFWPWLPLSALGLVALARTRPAPRGSALLFSWFFVVMAVLCASRSYFQRYLLPVVPVLIIAAAFALNGLLSRRRFSHVYRKAGVAAGIVVILLQILPVPLDNRGTDQIGVFEARGRSRALRIRSCCSGATAGRWGRAPVFYADRLLSRHFTDAAELARFLDTACTGTYGIANAADYEELRDLLGTALVERARPDGYVIFQSPAFR